MVFTWWRRVLRHRSCVSQRAPGAALRGAFYVPLVETLEKRELLASAYGPFVGQLYPNLLNRDAAAAELMPWTNLLESGRPRTAVARQIASSPEYRTGWSMGCFARCCAGLPIRGD